MEAAWPLTLNQYVHQHHAAFLKPSPLCLPLGFPRPQSPYLRNGLLGERCSGVFSSPALAESPMASFLRHSCTVVVPRETSPSPTRGPEPGLVLAAQPAPPRRSLGAQHGTNTASDLNGSVGEERRRECDAINCTPYLLFLCQPDVPGA